MSYVSTTSYFRNNNYHCTVLLSIQTVFPKVLLELVNMLFLQDKPRRILASLKYLLRRNKTKNDVNVKLSLVLIFSL